MAAIKRLLTLSFQHRVILVLLLLMNLPFFLSGFMAKGLMENVILQEKKSKLLALARVLDARLDPGGFAALLKMHGAENAPREEQILLLNKALRDISDEVGNSAPGLGVGYYSRDLDAIVTYGPSSLFAANVGVTIPVDHPGRKVMAGNVALAVFGSMVRGDIMNAMIPIERQNKVIGYIWANELTTDIEAQFNVMTRNIFLAMLACFVLTASLLLLLSRRTVRDMDRIITGVRGMRTDLSRRIPISGGELGEVVNSINAMAEDVGKSKEEAERAVAVLQTVMSNVDAMIYVSDPETNILVYANDYLCRLLQRDDVQGKPCFEVIHGLSAPCPSCPQRQLFDGDSKPRFTPLRWEMHNQMLKRDFLVTDRLVTWHDGRLLHMQVATDVTERNALALAEAANLAQRDFLARMSHEIRTPMNGVLGMTRLAMQADPPPAQMEYLKKIQTSASLLLGIINDILDFSRIEAGKLEIEKHPFSLHEMVENIRELILPRVRESGLELLIEVDPSVPAHVQGDGLRLSQVLLNLLGNASKFTLQGSITLAMRAEPLPSGALKLFCSVRDTGIGMSSEERQLLFKPFSQADISTSRKFGGTGLGLSISKAIVELMGGTISVDSSPGEGSVFSFFVELEQAADICEAVPKQDDPWESARYDGCRFLLVEDNTINQEIALAILEAMGAKADVTANGQEGLDAFLAGDYSLILMDVRMPVMDGLEAARRIRSSAKHDAVTVPIIAMTANAMLEDREASRQAGMNGHIAKPIDVNELKRTLFQLLHPDGTSENV